MTSSSLPFASLRLYSYWRSSCAWRVRIGLGLKGMAYEYVPVNIAPSQNQQYSLGYREKNAMQQVPLLECIGGAYDGKTLSQSVAILEFLDEILPSPALLPRDVWLRAQVRKAVEIVNSGTQPLQNLNVQKKIRDLGGDEKIWLKDIIHKGMVALEEAAATSAGQFFVGDEVTFADVCLVPQMYSARRYEVALDAFPKLVEIDARCMKLSAFANSVPERMPDAT